MKTRLSMQGKPVDMAKLMADNATMPAIGNMNVNAQGDLLGPGGTIAKTRDEYLKEYYSSSASKGNTDEQR